MPARTLFVVVDTDGEVYGAAETRDDCVERTLNEWATLSGITRAEAADELTKELLQGESDLVRLTVESSTPESLDLALLALRITP